MYNDVYSNCYMLKYLKQIVKIITQATPGHPIFRPSFSIGDDTVSMGPVGASVLVPDS